MAPGADGGTDVFATVGRYNASLPAVITFDAPVITSLATPNLPISGGTITINGLNFATPNPDFRFSRVGSAAGMQHLAPSLRAWPILDALMAVMLQVQHSSASLRSCGFFRIGPLVHRNGAHF